MRQRKVDIMAVSSEDIRNFILRNVEDHPKDITLFTARNFNLTRQGVLRHIRALIADGLLSVSGRTKGRKYSSQPETKKTFQIEINDHPKEEDVVWRNDLLPLLGDIKENVVNICQYGFTEMFNNVLEHSEASEAIVSIGIYPHKVILFVNDNGIGIFNKIQSELGLDDKRHAILELSKGKLTTDPAKHTGEGIFFTSRIFDEYAILSSDLCFLHTEPNDDWLIQREKSEGGTSIFMTIDTSSEREIGEVFNKFSVDDSFGFDKTHVPVLLSKYGQENLVSRSQAKRLLARFDRFKEVLLDFKDVDLIGQAFADEIFRVFCNSNPEVNIEFTNANNQVSRMIYRALSVAGRK